MTRAHKALAKPKGHHEHQAIEKVLTGRRNGLRVPAIIEAGLPLATSLKGKTPGQTFYSVLYAESKKADGLVVQVSRGTFKLNPKRRKTAPAKALFSPHDLRHRRVSLLHAQGLSWARIGEQVGHADLMTTARTYTHVLGDEAELEYASLLA